MPMKIHLLSDAEARARFGENEDWSGDTVDHGANATPAMLATLRAVAETFGEGDLYVMRDWEGCAVAECDPATARRIGIYGVLALTDDGRIGEGGVNQPHYFDSVEAMMARRA
jgi:hypothetical protein